MLGLNITPSICDSDGGSRITANEWEVGAPPPVPNAWARANILTSSRPEPTHMWLRPARRRRRGTGERQWSLRRARAVRVRRPKTTLGPRSGLQSIISYQPDFSFATIQFERKDVLRQGPPASEFIFLQKRTPSSPTSIDGRHRW